MSESKDLLSQVELIEGERHTDSRGWLHVVLRRHHLPEEATLGELYVVRSEAPGVRRGDHFHPEANEWFSVIEGAASFELQDPESGARRCIELRATPAQTLRVPAGLAHAIVNLGPGSLTVIAWADKPHDPLDVVPWSTQAQESL